MAANKLHTNVVLSIPSSLKTVGIITGSLGMLTILLSTAAYAVTKPGFNLFATYLSDIGATPVWPQVLWNAGMLVTSPLRYIVLVLLVLRLYQFGAGRTFGASVLIFGVFSTLGTIIMSAVPYTVNVNIAYLGADSFDHSRKKFKARRTTGHPAPSRGKAGTGTLSGRQSKTHKQA